MSDYQASLMFLTVFVVVVAQTITFLFNVYLLNSSKANHYKKMIKINDHYKDNTELMKTNGMNLIRQELMSREIKKYKRQLQDFEDRSFVVYDAFTGEATNYYEKKR